ncbi:hypothetical protein BV898_17684 [Hypsibius exemplaris]|uniref:Gustatory receptor n=1 Tax=Hypsibius exemplaris TaxID=2072580 RepID=A0A9X6NHD6_HYPEX|nr:hypothetical protein BV898_17684 [Hypsibius exemplaris]
MGINKASVLVVNCEVPLPSTTIVSKPPFSILEIQARILRDFGLVTSPASTSRRLTVRRAVGLTVIVGGWSMVALQLITYILDRNAQSVIRQSRSSLLLFIAQNMPYLTAMIRGVTLVTATFSKPDNLRLFFRGIQSFLTDWAKFRPIQAKQKKAWERKAVAFLLVFCICWTAWEAAVWCFDIQSQYKILNWQTTQQYMTAPAFTGLGQTFLMWHYIPLYLLFMVLPRFVSIQLSICVSISAILLRDGVALLKDQLRVGTQSRAINAFIGKQKKPLAFIADGIDKDKEVTSLVRFYEAITDFNVCLNDTIGVTFWLLYWMDVVAVLAFIAFALAANSLDVAMMLQILGGLVVHLAYLLLMVLPVASAFEKAREIGKMVYHWKIFEFIAPKKKWGKRRQLSQHKSLMTFANSLRTRPVLLDGNGLVDGDRHAVLLIFSVMLSFAIIAKEVLTASPSTDAIASSIMSSNVINGTGKFMRGS